MPTRMDRGQALKALQALGISPRDLDSIRMASYPQAKQMLVQLKELAKKRYRKLALQLHPDRTGGDPEKTEMFKVVGLVLEDLNKLEVQRPVARPSFTSATVSNTTNATFSGTVTWVNVQYASTQTTTRVKPSQARPMHVVNMRP